MVYIVALSAAAFLITLMDRTGLFYWLLAFDAKMIFHGEVWRIITWVISNFGGGIFGGVIGTVLQLYFYYFIGSTLENEWGTAKFSLFFFAGVIVSVIFGLLFWFIGGFYVRLSAVYIYLSMFFAFAILHPNATFLLFFFIPVRSKVLALIDAAIYVILIAIDIGAGDYFTALQGIVVAVILFMFCGSSLIGLIKREKRFSKRSVEFKSAARSAKYREENKPFRHQCSVCGRTDAAYPNLEFRYCSRCEGFHCFCIDHINNHVHFQ